MANKPNKPVTPNPWIKEAKSAFEALEEQIEAKKNSDTSSPSPRVDVGRAAALVLGSHGRVQPLRREIARFCGATDIAVVDRLRQTALAAWHANLRARSAREAQQVLPGLLEEAKPLRENLLRAAELHAHFGLLDAEEVGEIRAGLGTIDTAEDLDRLASLFEDNWAAVEGKTQVTREMFDRARELAAELLETVGTERGARSSDSEAVGTRNAAFELLVEVYDEVRRAVAYLRWHEEDADEIAPSLFTARRAPQRRAPDPEVALEVNGASGPTQPAAPGLN